MTVSRRVLLGFACLGLWMGFCRVVHAQTTDFTLHDPNRNRDIPLKVYYADLNRCPCPLIIFSHGYGGSNTGYSHLGKGWSEAGYIVILPTHYGSDTSVVRSGGLHGAKDQATAFQQQQQRTADISYIISSLEQQSPTLDGRIDRKRIGVGGHSMGAGTALLLAGAIAAVPGARVKSMRDSRVVAVIAMSPQGSGEEGFNQHSWADIRIPVMTMSGTRDGGVNGEPPSWRLERDDHAIEYVLRVELSQEPVANRVRHHTFL